MKKILSLFPLLVACLLVHAQQVSLHSNGYVSTFQKIDTLFLTEYAGQYPRGKTNLPTAGNDENLLPLVHSFGMISKSLTAAKAADTKFSTSPKKLTTAFYAFADGTLQAPTSTLFFKPRNAATVDKDFSRFGVVETHDVFKGYYYLQLNTALYNEGDKIFLLCDSLYQVGLATVIEPVFVRRARLNTEPMESQQWALNNTGQNGGTPGADMKVTNVWPYGFTGNNIRVAVIDVGVQLTHPDLQNNLLPGFDATGGNSNGAPENNSYNIHGTACAGIIAALRNNIGVVGVAPNAKIIPIRMAIADMNGNFSASDAQMVSCFTFAFNNGADIISSSWVYGSGSAQLDLAIQNMVQNGRNGNGALLFFSTGNINTSVGYPASNPNVIAVGASSQCDQRKSPTSCDGENWWGSNYGNNLDLIAPGVKIPTTTFGASSYMSDFNGTSSACPNAAAVAALILSAKPTLTGTEVRRALESSCDKIGGYNYQPNYLGQPNGTWSTEAGYGRVNAYNAVFAALNITLNGPNVLCAQGTYSIQNLPTGATLQWTASPSSAVTLTPQGTNVAIQRNSGSGSFYLNALITINGVVYTITKNIPFTGYNGPSHISLDPNTQSCLTYGSTRTFSAKDDNGLVCNNASIAELEWLVRDYSTSPATTVTNYTRQNCNGILNSAISINLHSNGSPYILEIVARAKDKCGNWGPWGPGNGYLIKPSCSSMFKAFTMSPNPANTNVTVAFTEDFEMAQKMSSITTTTNQKISIPSDDYEIQIWNNNGRLIKKMPGKGKSTSVSLIGLEKGIYYLNVIRDGATYKEILWVQ